MTVRTVRCFRDSVWQLYQRIIDNDGDASPMFMRHHSYIEKFNEISYHKSFYIIYHHFVTRCSIIVHESSSGLNDV